MVPAPSGSGELLSIAIPPWAFDIEELARCAINDCPSLATTDDGTIVAYDRIAGTLQVWSQPPRTVTLIEPLDRDSSSLVDVGADGEVAYLETLPPGATDPVGQLVAVSLDGANAGQIVATGLIDLDFSGDSTLVPTSEGLIAVGCCGFDDVSPDPSSPLAIRWVDRSGTTITEDRPLVSIERSDDRLWLSSDGAGSNIRRQRWPMPAMIQGFRDMPTTTVRGDGSVVMLIDEWVLDEQYLFVFKADGDVEWIQVVDDRRVILADAWGAVTHDGSRFQRWSLPTFTRPVDAMSNVEVLLGGNDSFGAAQDLIDAVVSSFRVGAECDGVLSEPQVSRRGDNPVVVVIESRNACDDSVVGANYQLTLAPDSSGQWTIVAATQRSLCLRGGGPDLCT